MNPAACQIRRATVDDLPQLRPLWQSMGFAAADLEKRLTDFQVAINPDGGVIGGVALQIADGQGLIHSEAFVDFSVADEVRPLLWERLQAVATNHGLLRVWTRENAPFWGHCGLSPATPEALARLPAPWHVKDARWLTFQRREETTTSISVEREFELFMQSERERTQTALEHAKTLKTLATVIAILLALAIVAGLVYVLRRNPHVLVP